MKDYIIALIELMAEDIDFDEFINTNDPEEIYLIYVEKLHLTNKVTELRPKNI